MLSEPGFVPLVEQVVAGESAFQAGEGRGPDAEVVGGGLQGDVPGFARGPEGSGVRGRLRLKEVVVAFPGDVAIQAPHGFP